MTGTSFSGTTLNIGDTTVEFDYPIREMIELEDKVLVLLEGEGSMESRSDSGVFKYEEVRSDNVIAIDKSGNQLWTIAIPESSQDSYEWIKENENGKIVAKHYNTWVYEIDLETGEIESLHWQK